MKNLLFIFLSIFLIAGCGESDPCDDIVCFQGDCINGACDCDPGWEGPSCDNERRPAQMRIVQYRILSFSNLNGLGMPWDPNELSTRADIFLDVFKVGNPDFICTTNSIENASSNERHIFNNECIIDDPISQYNILLQDFDEGSPNPFQLMSIFRMSSPYIAGQGFPSTMTIESDAGLSTLEIDVEYIF